MEQEVQAARARMMHRTASDSLDLHHGRPLRQITSPRPVRSTQQLQEAAGGGLGHAPRPQAQVSKFPEQASRGASKDLAKAAQESAGAALTSSRERVCRIYPSALGEPAGRHGLLAVAGHPPPSEGYNRACSTLTPQAQALATTDRAFKAAWQDVGERLPPVEQTRNADEDDCKSNRESRRQTIHSAQIERFEHPMPSDSWLQQAAGP
eukprot:scaffold357100_cov33-Prasinocladus_malaysianus.AAC.1